MLRTVAVACLFLVTGCTAAPAATSTAPATVASSRGPSPSAMESPTSAETSPSAATGSHPGPSQPVDENGGYLAKVIVDELIVRAAPGIGPDSDIYPGVLEQGKLLWLSGDAIAADGYDWYLAVAEHRPLLDEAPTIRSGWVAVASREGELWVERITPECPSAVTLTTIGSLSAAERFLCFDDRDLEIEGWVPPFYGSGGCGGEEPAWLLCFLTFGQLVSVRPPADALAGPGGAPGWDAGAARITLHFPPGTNRGLSAGQRVVVIGHFDDPAAAECGAPDFPDATRIIPEPSLIYECRGAFVVDAITVQDSPQ